MSVKRIVAAAAIALAVMAPTSAAASSSSATMHSIEDAYPCRTEDQARACYWDAQARGNGEGTSFYVMPKNSKGVYFKKGKRVVVVNLPKGAMVYDTTRSRTDGYVRRSTTKPKTWVIVCPKRGGWVLEELNPKAFVCN